MSPRRCKDMVIAAVERRGKDPIQSKTLDAIVAVLLESERGKEILRAKGYGTAGLSIDGTAALVPNNLK